MQRTIKNPVGFLWNIPLIVIIGFLASCSGIKSSPSEESLPLQQSTTQQIPAVDTSKPGWDLNPGQNLRFEKISLEDGLSQSTIFAMIQDKQGYMWFATEDGLNRYDGYNFTVYKHDPDNPSSLRDNWILSIYEDNSGTLWIGTRERGLEQYDSEHDQFIHFQNDPENPSSISDNEITTIFQDQDSFIWVGTGQKGLEKYDQENGIFIHYSHDPADPNTLSSNAVTEIYEDADGMLWVGTEDAGLNRFDRENNRWTNYRNNPDDPHSLSHDFVKAIIEDKSGNLWVGTIGGGLEMYDPGRDRFIHYHPDFADPEILSSDATAAIYQGQEGKFWVGTEGSGIYYFDPTTGTFINYQHNTGNQHSLSNNYVISIHEDREGVLWFGTLGAGINKLNNGWRNFPHYKNNANNPNSLSDNMVRAFLEETDSIIWVGTLDGGVDRFNRKNNSWNHYRHNPDDPGSLSNNFVSAIYMDRAGEIWIGTANGLDRFDPQTGAFTHYQPYPAVFPGTPSNNIRTIYEKPEGKFWIGTKGGLFRFDSEDNAWIEHYEHDPTDPHSLSENWIFSFMEDRDGIIWLGTFGGGLNRFDPDKKTFTRFQSDPNDPDSLSNSFTPAISQDSEGSIWIATSGGLDKYNQQTQSFNHYQDFDGLASNTIYCGLEDNHGNIWLGTSKGLSWFDPKSETFKNYDVGDGLQSNEFNGAACYRSEDGEMFFGGINGFNAFFPDQIQDNQTIPPIVLTSFTQDGKVLDPGKSTNSMTQVALKYPDNSFEFEFAALSYSNPENNHYAYMLEGFDTDWIETGTRRYGKYTNLPGGTYTLRMKGSNSDGVWNEDGATLAITVVPPYWGTWWFRGVFLIIMLGLGYGGFRVRVNNLEKRGRELENQVKERTSELVETQNALRQRDLEKAVTDERGRLARDLHDSVTQSLYSLTLFTEAARHMAEETGNDEIEGYVGQIGTIGLQALKEMRLLVFELRPSALDKEGLAQAIRKRLSAVEGRAGVDAKVFADEFPKLTGEIEQEFFRIAQEALNNSIKHAGASSVTVYLRHKDGLIEMEIIDDGIGFDPDNLTDSGGMGLKNIQERTERIGGTVLIKSKPTEGTSIKISIENSDNVV